MNVKELTLEQYKALVTYLKDEKRHDVIDNDTVEHASILVQALVESAKEKIRLHTTSFCEDFYSRPEIKNAFQEASERNIEMDIISRNDLDENSVFQEYQTMFPNLHITTLPEGIKVEHENEIITLNNFMLIDHNGIRYEQGPKETKCENLMNVNARATFNRPSDVEFFIKNFDNAISTSK